MSLDIATVVLVEPKPNVPALSPGDTAKVSIRVVEGERTRSQAFQGVVIRVKEGGVNSSFTVRRVAYGVGVERTFFFASPSLEKVEVLRHGKVRRAKLYYLRGLTAKKARLKERRVKEREPEESQETQETPNSEPQTAPGT